ncbi:MAG: hypothetical protein ACFFB0_02345 [Promethearchaeota archaeon]
MMLIIAKNKEEVGISAIDFFSFTHIVLGYLILLTNYTILNISLKISFDYLLLLLNVIASISWEVLENFLLYKFKIKYRHRRDSKINVATDMVFFFLGGVIGIYIIHQNLTFFIIYSFIIIGGFLLITDIYAFLLLNIKN